MRSSIACVLLVASCGCGQDRPAPSKSAAAPTTALSINTLHPVGNAQLEVSCCIVELSAGPAQLVITLHVVNRSSGKLMYTSPNRGKGQPCLLSVRDDRAGRYKLLDASAEPYDKEMQPGDVLAEEIVYQLPNHDLEWLEIVVPGKTVGVSGDVRFLTLARDVGITKAVVPLPEKPAPADVIRRAIAAHGGEDKLARTLTGQLKGEAFLSLGPTVATVQIEEVFELPRRYARVIQGKVGDGIQREDFFMAYAVTEGKGWVKKGTRPVEDFAGMPLPLAKHWNAVLAVLPDYLADDVQLALVPGEQVDNEATLGVSLSRGGLGEARIFFGQRSGLQRKARKVAPHPITGQEADVEVRYTDYKKVDGVQFPHRITASSAGDKSKKTIFDIRIEKIEFTKVLNEKLFERPER